MCYGHHRSVSPDDLIATARNRRSINDHASALLQDLHGRLTETEALLERARAREADLTRRLDEMKRFVSVMAILESYLKRRCRHHHQQQQQQQQHVSRLDSPLPAA